MLKIFDLSSEYIHRGTNNNTKLCLVGSSRTLAESGYGEYMQARVEKLRELYEKHKPEIKKTWVLPKGETDGRKSIVVEEIIGEDISPFDLPDFEEQMPKWENYINKYKG
tara:strand:+ start:517 stop:846 length:330 start_codon:yes stop_codon:yes gene_type:complete